MKKFLLYLILATTALCDPTPNRLKDKTPASAPASDDKIYIDGATNGTRALDPGYFAPAASTTSGLAGKQASSSNLTIFAGITPSANIQTLLGASNYIAARGLLSADTALTVGSLSSNALAMAPKEWPIKTVTWSTNQTLTYTGGSNTAGDGQVIVANVTSPITLTVTPTSASVYRNGSNGALGTSISVPVGIQKFIFWTPNTGSTVYLDDTIVTASDVPYTPTPTNYTPASADVAGHLAGIDTKLGTLGGGGGGGSLAFGTYFGFNTSKATLPTNALIADGTYGTDNLGVVAGSVSWYVMGGGAVAAPTFSPVAGSYGSTQTVTISSATSGATIKYTTDGTTTPTRSVGSTYSAPLSIAATTTLKALAYKNLYTDSGVTTGTFTISSGYLLTDDVEYSSNSAATAAGWALTAGSPNFGYNTSPAPLLGSYSLRLNSLDEVNHSFTSTASVEGFAAINIASLAVDQYPLAVKDGSLTNLVYIKVQSDGSVTVYHGGGYMGAAPAGTITAGSTFYYWLSYGAGTGSNGTTALYISSTQTKPGSPLVTGTTGSATANAADFSFYSSSGNVIVDKVRVSSSSIGSNPP